MKLFKPDQYTIYYQGYPKLYIRIKPIFWWLKKWSSLMFILRELTSVAVGYYAVVLIMMLRAIDQGPQALSDFQAWFSTPLAIIINIIALALAIYHSITWFSLAPKAMVIQIGKNRVPGFLISGMNYGAWVVLSIALIWFFTNMI